MGSSRAQDVLDLLKKEGILRPRDLVAHGIQREYLARLLRRGLVERGGRGLYVLPGGNVTAHHSFAEAGKRVPHGVVCLLSALRFHGLTTQNPFEVWMMIDRKARLPNVGIPPMRVFRASGAALSAGIHEHRIENVTVRVYGVAKTIADCFKYRNKIGLDVAMEALREARRHRRASMDELWQYAKVCRVANVMRPYLEAIG